MRHDSNQGGTAGCPFVPETKGLPLDGGRSADCPGQLGCGSCGTAILRTEGITFWRSEPNNMTPSGHAGASIVAAYVVTRCVFKCEATPAVLGLSAIMGLLPDADSLIATIVRRQWPNQQKLRHHQFSTHTPLLYLVITLLVSLVVPAQTAILVGVLALTHLVLDSWATDDGIMWLWPMSRQQFSLFPRRLHAGGAHGLRFYRRHVRCWYIMVPEVGLLLGASLLTLRTLVVS